MACVPSNARHPRSVLAAHPWLALTEFPRPLLVPSGTLPVCCQATTPRPSHLHFPPRGACRLGDYGIPYGYSPVLLAHPDAIRWGAQLAEQRASAWAHVAAMRMRCGCMARTAGHACDAASPPGQRPRACFNHPCRGSHSCTARAGMPQAAARGRDKSRSFSLVVLTAATLVLPAPPCPVLPRSSQAEVLKAVLAAAAEGYRYAAQHPAEAAGLFCQARPAPRTNQALGPRGPACVECFPCTLLPLAGKLASVSGGNERCCPAPSSSLRHAPPSRWRRPSPGGCTCLAPAGKRWQVLTHTSFPQPPQAVAAAHPEGLPQPLDPSMVQQSLELIAAVGSPLLGTCGTDQALLQGRGCSGGRSRLLGRRGREQCCPLPRVLPVPVDGKPASRLTRSMPGRRSFGLAAGIDDGHESAPLLRGPRRPARRAPPDPAPARTRQEGTPPTLRRTALYRPAGPAGGGRAVGGDGGGAVGCLPGLAVGWVGQGPPALALCLPCIVHVAESAQRCAAMCSHAAQCRAAPGRCPSKQQRPGVAPPANKKPTTHTHTHTHAAADKGLLTTKVQSRTIKVRPPRSLLPPPVVPPSLRQRRLRHGQQQQQRVHRRQEALQHDLQQLPRCRPPPSISPTVCRLWPCH